MTSRQKAIREMCRQCVAADKQHSWVKDVENCCGYSCPLFHLRPVRNAKGEMIDAHRLPVTIAKLNPALAQAMRVSLPPVRDQTAESHKTENRMLPTGGGL